MSHMPRKKHKLKKKEREREKPGNMQDAQGKNNIIPITYQGQISVSCTMSMLFTSSYNK